ncbi:MAG: sulfite exporter TauE/SafE family protein [Bacteroidota bacterium]
MNIELSLLCATAASVGFVHTLLGPDHYIPFIAISKARNWSLRKSISIVVLCGLGHVLSSILLGFIGIALGSALLSLTAFESLRGVFAGYLLIIFGFVYMVWGIKQAVKNRRHEHFHYHEGEIHHSHEHNHLGEHSHIESENKKNITPWVLFLIFIFGPCEPLIPLIMYPAARHNMFAVFIVSLIFGLITIATMTAITVTALLGFKLLDVRKLERYMHALAGFAIFICGISVILFDI